jgi:hypothetical protein
MITKTKNVNYYYGKNIEYTTCFREGVISNNELPKSVALTKYNPIKNTFNIRLQFSDGGIEIPINISKMSNWLNEIKKREREIDAASVEIKKVEDNKVEEEEVSQENDIENNEVFYLSL